MLFLGDVAISPILGGRLLHSESKSDSSFAMTHFVYTKTSTL
jgi:hypothetical protein